MDISITQSGKQSEPHIAKFFICKSCMNRKALLMNSFSWMARGECRRETIELCSLVSANLLLQNDFRHSVARLTSHVLASNQKPNEGWHSITHVSICSIRHHYRIHTRSNKEARRSGGLVNSFGWLFEFEWNKMLRETPEYFRPTRRRR